MKNYLLNYLVQNLKVAYFQQPDDDKTSEILAIDTHRGLFSVQ